MRSSAGRAAGRAARLSTLLCAAALGCSRSAPERAQPPGASASASAASAPLAPGPPACLDARPACRGRLAVGAAGKQLAYYASRPLGAADARPTRAVIILHGARHSPEGYFQTMTRLAGEHGGLDETVVIAPHFQTGPDVECWGTIDTPAADELFWSCEGWKMGRPAENGGALSSFEAIDALLASLGPSFPHLTRITLAGHSAGAQLVQRYAVLRRAEDAAVPIRYLVSSPSSYLYLDDRRLEKGARCTGPADCALDPGSFAVPSQRAKGCPGYDDFKYGLARREGYAASLSAADLRRRYAARDLTMLLGDLDTGRGPGAAFGELDRSCAAELQGPEGRSFRRERGLVYLHYVTALFGAKHRLEIVPGCRHDEACLFASPPAVRALFGP